ncbi:hypothetical protein [Halomarina rubra]|uniref:Uncharacterized protein n=1 Tax=Halomarina rubra TaxID=2071873 RepID=A0ABD6AQ72_9EURY|nr:hypothetical protein [Halomarina rubra]
MNRSALLTALLVVAGVVLVAVPLAAPAEEPPDRYEYYVERTDGEIAAWETRYSANFTERERAVFDAALRNESGRYTVSEAELGSVPPFVNGTVAVSDVRHDGQWYLVEAKRFDRGTPLSAHLPRLGALLGGLGLALAGGYRAVMG